MNRLFFSFSAVLLLCSTAAAQNPSSDPAAGATPATDLAGVTETVSPEVALFQKIEDKWSDAVNQHDQYGLELVLSPLFVDVSATGDVTTLNQQVAQVLSNEDKTLYLTQKVVTVRMLGDIAVANGTYTLRHKIGNAPVDEKGIFTHVYERVRSGWICINSQRTVLRQEASAKQRKEQSNESSFHFPFFSKGDKGPQ